jgi:hypothetical protein
MRLSAFSIARKQPAVLRRGHDLVITHHPALGLRSFPRTFGSHLKTVLPFIYSAFLVVRLQNILSTGVTGGSGVSSAFGERSLKSLGSIQGENGVSRPNPTEGLSPPQSAALGTIWKSQSNSVERGRILESTVWHGPICSLVECHADNGRRA